ncbi:MAG: phage head-tail joining protein [Roseococcus sp.]
MELSELKRLREELAAARFSGALTVKAGEQWVTYKSEAELRAALEALNRDIAAAEGRARSRRLLAWCSKGL